MKTKILFKFSFENGWGDTFLSVFDIVNCADFLKKEYPELEINLVINDEHNVKTLQQVLNLKFFNKLFDKFEILNGDKCFRPVNGVCTYNNENYRRLYSGRNEDVSNNTNGIFDVFVLIDDYKLVENLKIPFSNFTFNDIDDRPKLFNVFNTDIVKNVEIFINDNFKGEFDSIYYRCVPPLNEQKILRFRDKLVEMLDSEKEYFICSNANFVKKVFSETNLNLKMYRSLEQHDPNVISNGFTRSGQTIEEALFVVGELILLGKSRTIYYSGDMTYTSLFNWYAINIKKVKLEEIVL